MPFETNAHSSWVVPQSQEVDDFVRRDAFVVEIPPGYFIKIIGRHGEESGNGVGKARRFFYTSGPPYPAKAEETLSAFTVTSHSQAPHMPFSMLWHCVEHYTTLVVAEYSISSYNELSRWRWGRISGRPGYAVVTKWTDTGTWGNFNWWIFISKDDKDIRDIEIPYDHAIPVPIPAFNNGSGDRAFQNIDPAIDTGWLP